MWLRILDGYARSINYNFPGVICWDILIERNYTAAAPGFNCRRARLIDYTYVLHIGIYYMHRVSILIIVMALGTAIISIARFLTASQPLL